MDTKKNIYLQFLALIICVPDHNYVYTLLLFILIGVTLNLRGSSIPTDGSGRIVITDINPDGDNDEDALFCQSELVGLSDVGNWFLHPTQQTTDGSVRILGNDPRGWRRSRGGQIQTHRLVRLRRDDSIANEGRALEGVIFQETLILLSQWASTTPVSYM